MFDQQLTPTQNERRRLLQNRAWLNDNFAQIQQSYADKWILVLDESIAGSDTDVEVLKQASEERRGEALIMRVPAGAVTTPI